MDKSEGNVGVDKGSPTAENMMAKAVSPSSTLASAAAAVASGSSPVTGPWDPLHCPDWDSQKPNKHCLQRIQRDLSSIFKEPPPGIFVVPDDADLTSLHALVVGPFDSPYEGGFFYFRIRCPPNYPIRPPRVRLMTTGDDTVRFNPNLYRNGKVCLSILGTWQGPSWSPSQSLSSVMLSIQSLLCEKPYHNEPGFEKEHGVGESDRYNQIVAHETVRVGVCDMLEGTSVASRRLPPGLQQTIKGLFPSFYDHYKEVCEKLIALGLQGSPMADPFGEKRGKFDPQGLLARLAVLHDSFPQPPDSGPDDDSD